MYKKPVRGVQVAFLESSLRLAQKVHGERFVVHIDVGDVCLESPRTLRLRFIRCALRGRSARQGCNALQGCCALAIIISTALNF